MSEHKGFFGNIFDSTDDDPLLQSDPGGDDSSGNGSVSSSNTGGGLFSAYTSASRSDGGRGPTKASGDAPQPGSTQKPSAPSPPSASEHDDYQTVVVQERNDPWTQDDAWDGLDALNDAVQTGWHVVNIEPSRETADAPLQLSILLERDIPRSLFDFGGPM